MEMYVDELKDLFPLPYNPSKDGDDDQAVKDAYLWETGEDK